MKRHLLIFLGLACVVFVGAGAVRTTVVVQPTAAAPAGGPTVSSVALDKSGTYATITFSESVTVGAGGNGGVAASLSSGTTTATYLSGSGSTALIYTCWPPVMPSVTATWAYTQPGNGWEATSGGADVATFSSQASTNNSTVVLWADMEGTGYGGNGSWTENVATDGTVDEDYTTSVISGSQSLFLDEGTGGDVDTYADLGSDYGALAMRVRHKIDTKSGVNITGHPCAAFYDSGGTARAGLRYNYTNASDVCAIVARIATTNGTAGTTTWTGTDSVYLWMDFSNTDDVVNAHWSSTLTKPATDGAQSSTSSVSVTAAVRRVVLVETHANERRLFDDLVVWVP